MIPADDAHLPLHVVQVGLDDTIFQTAAPSDTRERQVAYGRALAALAPGARMTFVSATRRRAAAAFTIENVTFRPMPWSRWRRWTGLAPVLDGIHRDCPISVVATQMADEDAWAALRFGRRAGVPVVGQVHVDIFSPWLLREKGWLRWPIRWLRRQLGGWVVRRLDGVRVVSQTVADAMAARRMNADVRVLPVPISMGAAAPSAPRRPRVLFVGRLAPEKNLPGWLGVARRLARSHPAVEFHVIGGGALLEPLRAQAAAMGLGERVVFHGPVAYDLLPQHYQSASVFFLWSRYEGFGRVLVEAQLNGLPVVCARIAGALDIIEDGVTGRLVDGADERAAATAIAQLLDQPEQAAAMAARARQAATARFDAEALARRWMGMLRDVAERGKSR